MSWAKTADYNYRRRPTEYIYVGKFHVPDFEMLALTSDIRVIKNVVSIEKLS